MFFSRLRLIVLPIALVVALLTSSFIPARAALRQQGTPTPGTSLVVDDVIQSINGTTWVVGGRTIVVTSQTVISGAPIVGKKAHLVVVADPDGQWIAQSITIIIIIVPASATPLPTTTFTPTPNITPTPSPSVLPSITPGGPTLTPTFTLTATAIVPLTSTPIPYVTIVIEGPVELIDLNVDIIVVYGQRIKLKHDDPLRTKLKVKDWVHISGNYGVDVDQQVVIVVVVIIIIDAPTIIIVVPPSGSSGNDGGDDDGKHKHKDD